MSIHTQHGVKKITRIDTEEEFIDFLRYLVRRDIYIDSYFSINSKTPDNVYQHKDNYQHINTKMKFSTELINILKDKYDIHIVSYDTIYSGIYINTSADFFTCYIKPYTYKFPNLAAIYREYSYLFDNYNDRNYNIIFDIEDVNSYLIAHAKYYKSINDDIKYINFRIPIFRMESHQVNILKDYLNRFKANLITKKIYMSFYNGRDNCEVNIDYL